MGRDRRLSRRGERFYATVRFNDISGDFADQGSVHVTRADLTGTAVWGYARYFLGQSFNVLAGFGLREAKANLRIEDTATDQFFESNLKVSSMVLPLALGNHWVYDGGFTIGCDWLAVLVPITGTASTQSSSNIDDPGIDKVFDDFQTLGERLAKSTSLTLGLTTVGWQF